MPDLPQDPICEKVKFRSGVVSVGYIPINTDIIYTGAISFTVENDISPYTVGQMRLESDCLFFPNDADPPVYNQDHIVLGFTAGETVFVPFMLNVDACGKFSCEIAYEITFDEQEEPLCLGTIKVDAYVANCDFQKCLLGISEAVFCNPDCNTDICTDNCAQRFWKLVMIDNELEYKIIQKAWAQVDDLYRSALTLCQCNCAGLNPNTYVTVLEEHQAVCLDCQDR